MISGIGGVFVGGRPAASQAHPPGVTLWSGQRCAQTPTTTPSSDTCIYSAMDGYIRLHTARYSEVLAVAQYFTESTHPSIAWCRIQKGTYAYIRCAENCSAPGETLTNEPGKAGACLLVLNPNPFLPLCPDEPSLGRSHCSGQVQMFPGLISSIWKMAPAGYCSRTSSHSTLHLSRLGARGCLLLCAPSP